MVSLLQSINSNTLYNIIIMHFFFLHLRLLYIFLHSLSMQWLDTLAPPPTPLHTTAPNPSTLHCKSPSARPNPTTSPWSCWPTHTWCPTVATTTPSRALQPVSQPACPWLLRTATKELSLLALPNAQTSKCSIKRGTQTSQPMLSSLPAIMAESSRLLPTRTS